MSALSASCSGAMRWITGRPSLLEMRPARRCRTSSRTAWKPTKAESPYSGRVRSIATVCWIKWILWSGLTDVPGSRPALQRVAVPLPEVRRRVVGTLEERQQRVHRRACGPDGGVGQDEDAHILLVGHGAGQWDEVSQARGLGCRVGIERRLLHGATAGPEAGADHLVRVALLRHPVRPRPLGGPAPREPRHREIEAAPEKMHRAAFAEKRRAKPLEHVIGLDEDAPVPIRILGIVRSMLLIVREANLVLRLDRHGPDLDAHAQRVECGEIGAVECRHGARA